MEPGDSTMNWMLTTRLLPAALLAVAVTTVAAPATAAEWSLVWADEFAQPDGSSPDSSRWGFDLGGHGWGNNELQTYTSRTNNARVEAGQLVIEARQENFTGTDGIARNYTSARLKTKGKASWTYGRFEARIKVPRGQGFWPAFWMLGTNFDSAGWPGCGEIDLMENIGSVPTRVHGTIHGPGYSGGNGIGGTYTLPGGAAYPDDFHVFAAEWETNRIRWFVDGQPYFTVTSTNLPPGANWVFAQPQFILLNLAVGGNWPGNPNGTTEFPQRLTVDYVRVFAATNSSATTCGGNVLSNPGFEIGGLNTWTTYGAGFNTRLGSSNDLPVHGGSNVFKLFGQFTGSENYSGVFRDTPVVPGSSFTALGWALTPEGDSLAAGNKAWIEVSFRDSTENILSMYRSAILHSSSSAGVWHLLAVTNRLDPSTFAVLGTSSNLVAPVGAAFARYQVVFYQPDNAAGAVLFDDLNLNAPDVPAPAAAVRNGSALNISFPTYLGLGYQVRYKSNLADNLWHVLTNVTGDGGAKIISDALNGQRFYRVLRVCN